MATRNQRTLVLGDKTYRYCITRCGGAVIYTPNGKKHVASFFELTGCSPDTYERGVWKRTSDGMVRPRTVRKYIQRELL